MSYTFSSRTLGCTAAVGLLAILTAAGCGGGGPVNLGTGNSTGGNGGTTASNATAKFHVDVKSGRVSITPLNGVNNKAFRGSAVQFDSSVLVDQPGSNGRKVLRVKLTNRAGEPMGATKGVNVLFSNFTNVAAFTDLRPKTTVSTFAGTGTQGSTDGPIGSATVNHPRSAAIGPDGALYFCDTVGNKIRRISGGMITTVAGSGAAGSRDGAGSNATFNSPSGIAIDSYGLMYIADTGNNKIRKIWNDGAVTTVAGTGAAGITNGSGDTATLNHPYGVAFNEGSSLYITEDNDIRKIDYAWSSSRIPSDYNVTAVAGAGTVGSADGVGTQATFNGPRGIAFDPLSKDFFVADFFSNKIRRVSQFGEVVTVAGNGNGADADGIGTAAALNGPMGVTYWDNALFVSEYAGKSIRQLRVLNPGNSTNSPSNWMVSTIAGSGAAGSNNGTGDVATFTNPYFLVADAGSNLYVCDYGSNYIRKIRPATGAFPIGVPTGVAPAEPVQLFNPDGIIPNSVYGTNLPFINYNGYLSAADWTTTKDWVFIVPQGVTAFEFSVTVESDTDYGAPPEAGTNQGSPNVDVRTLAGAKPGFVDGNVSEARFGSMNGMATDTAGNIYIADTSNQVIRRIGVNGHTATIAGAVGGGAGYVNGAGNIAKFASPGGIAVSADGQSVFVADTNNHAIRMVVRGAGDVENAQSWTVYTIAGKGTAGFAEGSGDVASLNAPYGIAISPGNVVYFSERLGNRIKRIQVRGGDPTLASNWQVATLAGDNTALAGAAGSTDATGVGARFSNPLGVAVDRAGNVLVSDSGNNRVRKITPDGVVTTLAGSTAGYNDALTVTAQFNAPNGICVDSSNYAYVADLQTNHIRRISPTGDVKTVAGTGVGGTVNGPGNVATFSAPTAIAVDKLGTLYVADFNVGTVRMVQRVLVGMKK